MILNKLIKVEYQLIIRVKINNRIKIRNENYYITKMK